ncbi:hypothetical protein [Dickeya zeae]|uniref:hypothetical protein n=1 Tax=Dickeya zeae TaxID=204042 RepID=UPI000368327D|nr:hypothetical protein [Dickeya zeae]UJR54988.1 hypothetical protein J417_13615 [Dickeya zeae MS1]
MFIVSIDPKSPLEALRQSACLIGIALKVLLLKRSCIVVDYKNDEELLSFTGMLKCVPKVMGEERKNPGSLSRHLNGETNTHH